ncbi:fimbrial protein [Burkholderia cepacia]|uniref:fimbrial protein n=1 Tax=Burkholderia cepacia TaxID=292 RepID=UPI0009B93E6B|nr:fimbrial protein [Burkholderia cepacia]
MNEKFFAKRMARAIQIVAGVSAIVWMLPKAAADSVTANGGQIHFIGQVVDAPCTISTQSAIQIVNLGQVKMTDLNSPGAKQSPLHSVDLKLETCSVDTYKNASFTFSGATSVGDSTVLSNDGGSATNVGVFMVDQTGASVKFDSSTATAVRALSNGSNTITMQAGMQAVGGAATAGSVRAVANFNVTYS